MLHATVVSTTLNTHLGEAMLLSCHNFRSLFTAAPHNATDRVVLLRHVLRHVAATARVISKQVRVEPRVLQLLLRVRWCLARRKSD
jgi:hypothetical protein